MSRKSPGTPTNKGDAEQGPEQNEPSGDLADRMAVGPAGTQLGDDGQIKLPEGAKDSTVKEAKTEFPDKKIELSKGGKFNDRGDLFSNDVANQVWPASGDHGPTGTMGVWGRKDFQAAVDEVAAAVKKLCDAGLGGQVAAETAVRMWHACN